MRRVLIRIAAVSVLAAQLVSGCGDGGGGGARVAGCATAAAPKPRPAHLSAPRQMIRPGEQLIATVLTSCGGFAIALDTKRAPKTTNSFAYLARRGFYDGLQFQRVVSGFLIQGGDPLGNGTGGPGYHVDEPPPPNLAYTRGVVAMAKTSVEPPGRSGSQFFVVTVPDAGLSPDSALLGRVSEGMAVIDRIGRLGTPAGRPRQVVLIKRITIKND